jgi:ribosomal protein L29
LYNQTEILRKEKEITNLMFKVNTMQSDLSEINQFKGNIAFYENMINNKKEELFLLFKKDTHSYCEDFKKKNIYSKIIELSTQKKDKDIKILTYQEQDILDQEIKKTFSRFINDLKSTYPTLTDDDIKLCCLSLLNLGTYAISLCFTVSGSNTIKQRRHRIKCKMADDSENSFMYDFIFNKRQ